MNRNKPFIVEFTGTPEAGKTTIIYELIKKLTNLGYKVKVYPESAELTPKLFEKNSIEAKLWMNFDTSKNILEAAFLKEFDIVIFDRGAYDRIFWIYLDSIYNFEMVSKYAFLSFISENYPPDLLLAFFVSTEESIKRRGGEGRVVTNEFVSTYNKLLASFVDSITTNKSIVHTDNKTIEEVLTLVTTLILEKMQEP